MRPQPSGIFKAAAKRIPIAYVSLPALTVYEVNMKLAYRQPILHKHSNHSQSQKQVFFTLWTEGQFYLLVGS